MIWAARRDKNEREIIDALISRGVTVYQVSSRDLPDLLIMSGGRFYLLEVKTKTGKLRPGQREFFRLADEQGAPAYVVRTVRQALDVLKLGAT